MVRIMRRAFILGLVCGSFLGRAPAAERVETLDLRAVEGNVVAISADKVELLVDGKAQPLPLADVESVAFRECEDLMARPALTVVRTAAGDLLAAEQVSVSDGNLRFTSPVIGPVELPLSAVSWVYLPAPGQTPGAVLKRAAEVTPPQNKALDMVIVDHGKEWAGVAGVLVAFAGDKITFRLGEEDKQIETRLVKAIRLATPPATASAAGRLTCTDGSEVLFRSLKLEGEALSLQTGWGRPVHIPRKSAASVAFLSQRATPLSTLGPAEATEYGFFDTKFPHRMNRAVDGGPIRIGGRAHASGVGMNSFTSLTWKLDGQYKTFVAVAGIDDAVRPLGNATLTFLADGKELGKPLTLTGKDAPQDLRLDLGGAKTFTVRVDFGPDNLPVGDHVDLGSARLLK